jgi:hypothetical protein
MVLPKKNKINKGHDIVSVVLEDVSGLWSVAVLASFQEKVFCLFTLHSCFASLVGIKIFCSSLIASSSVPLLPYFPTSSNLGSVVMLKRE